MNFRSLAVVLLLGLAPGAYAQNLEKSPEVEAVRARYAAINGRQAKLTKVEKSVWGISAEGASVTAYLDGLRVEKIVLEALGESGRWEAEFYFDEKELLVFAFLRDTRYAYPIGVTHADVGGPKRKDTKSEERLYFVDDALRWWTTGQKREPAKGDAAAKEKEVQTQAYVLLRGVKLAGVELRFDGAKYVSEP